MRALLKCKDSSFTPLLSSRTNIIFSGIVFLRDTGCSELVTQVPHIAFQVDDLDAEIKGCKILFGPYSPLKGYRVAMIEEQGVPIELVETSLTDEELSLLKSKRSWVNRISCLGLTIV